jgi:hypothetical protein
MAEFDPESSSANVNVTLVKPDPVARSMVGKKFPCPVCGVGAEIRLSRKEKPYCVCEPCGIQIFFRAKEGIRRLREIFHSQTLITANGSKADLAVVLFNRIQQLKEQKRQLQVKQGLIFFDSDLENAISAVDNEIERVQGELRKLGRKTKREKSKWNLLFRTRVFPVRIRSGKDIPFPQN